MYCIQCISTLNAIRIERNPWALGSTVNPKRNAFKNLNWRNFQLNMLLFTLKSNTMFNPHLIQRSNNSHYQTSCGSFTIRSNTEKTFLPHQGSNPGPQITKRPRYHRATTPSTRNIYLQTALEVYPCITVVWYMKQLKQDFSYCKFIYWKFIGYTRLHFRYMSKIYFL